LEKHVDQVRLRVTLEATVSQMVDAAPTAILSLGISSALKGEETAVHAQGFKGVDRAEVGLPNAQERLLRGQNVTKTATTMIVTSLVSPPPPVPGGILGPTLRKKCLDWAWQSQLF
jgi:hypothetical protein